MLASSRLQTIVWTSRIAEAEKFYGGVLGLPLKGKSHGALVYDVGGSDLRVSPVPSTQPSAHTVLGFAVICRPAAFDAAFQARQDLIPLIDASENLPRSCSTFRALRMRANGRFSRKIRVALPVWRAPCATRLAVPRSCRSGR